MARLGEGRDAIDNGQDIIDSRDIIARIEYLEEIRQEAIDAAKEARERLNELEKEDALTAAEVAERDKLESDVFCFWKDKEGTEYAETLLWAEDTYEEFQSLRSLAEEAGGCADWDYGATLIRESYFEEYAQDLANDLGYIKDDSRWPYNHINWEAAADELKQDYSAAEFDGVTYYVRD